MSVKPTVYPEWGTEEINQSIDIDGLIVTFGSKIEPTAEWKRSGAKYKENTPRQYINYQFDNISRWVSHLDTRYEVGDIHLTISAEDNISLSTRLGGTWVQRGTQVTGTVTSNVWEKTA